MLKIAAKNRQNAAMQVSQEYIICGGASNVLFFTFCVVYRFVILTICCEDDVFCSVSFVLPINVYMYITAIQNFNVCCGEFRIEIKLYTIVWMDILERTCVCMFNMFKCMREPAHSIHFDRIRFTHYLFIY